MTSQGNRHVLVFQDFLTKWPMVSPIPDQKSQRLVEILVQDIVPFFGVPEALLSDCGANLLSHLMLDVCKLLGIEKLNTTAYHPQCNGLVERFNRTLKTALRKHAAKFGRGIATCRECCGRTGILHTRALVRSPRTSCSGSTVEPLQKLPCYHLHIYSLPR